MPPWWRVSRRRRRRLFLRLAAVFGIIAALLLIGMAVVAVLVTRLAGGDGQTALLVWFAACGLALALPLLAVGLASAAFRRIATPLADVMAAADAVADGDLSVRIPEAGPRDFRQLAQSFNRMAEELERADMRRRTLTADVAHELRTPVHIIQGNLEGVLDGVYEPTEAHITATLEETQALARLVEDLRVLSLAEAGQLPLIREAVDVDELLTDLATSFSGQADMAGVDLRVQIDESPGESESLAIVADAGRLNQVLSNLVANGLRHTPEGGSIVLGATRTDQWVRIMVSDTGEGIPPKDLPYIFDRFWKGDRSRSHIDGAGSGLGLAIARELVQAHGGRIHVESEPGRGTTFVIDLPHDLPGMPAHLGYEELSWT